MNHRIRFLTGLKFALFYAAFAAGMSAVAQSAVQTNAVPQTPLSVFIQPASPQEGRDPFYPNSNRPYQSQMPLNTPTSDLSSLVLQGIYGVSGHRLAIINNVTFAVGDELEVRTPRGGRIRIQCVEIQNDSAVIEADGQRQELHYGEKP
jgi:hypothetical protein